MSTRALQNQHRQATATRLKRWSRLFLFAAATLSSFLVVGLLILDRLYQPQTFVIQQLKVIGQFDNIAPQQIEQLVIAQPPGNFFSVNLNEIEQRIEKLAWISDAQVRRQWPNTLAIRLREHQPLMVWNNQAWVTDKGEIVELPDKTFADHDVRLFGPGGQAGSMLALAQRWQQQLSASQIRLLALMISDSGAVDLRLQDSNSAFQLLLGSRDTSLRLSRFQDLYNSQFRYSGRTLVRADARYPDGIAINEGLSTKPVDFHLSGERL